MTTAQRAKRIRGVIQAEETRLVQAHPWLANRDWIGLAFFLGSLLAMGCVAAAYLGGHLRWWLAIPLMAIPLSILHELEHDTIHALYFRRRPWVQHVMFGVIWFAKLSLNPWYRREIHLKHHLVSGQENDIEERLIGLGLPFGPLRAFVTLHPLGGLLLFPRIRKEAPEFRPLRLILLSLPSYALFALIWESFFGYWRVQNGWAFAYDPARLLPAWGYAWSRDLAVLLALPNMLRQACLVFMSSHCHYYGDIPERDVFYQSQILDSWVFAPLQVFCFNFGATHIIHHYVINQPFYLRQLVAPAACAELRRQGTRTNDLGTFVRANRWSDARVMPAQSSALAPVRDDPSAA